MVANANDGIHTDSHCGQDQEHGEVDLDHHVNVLGVPGVRKMAVKIEMSIFIQGIFFLSFSVSKFLRHH